MREYLLAYVINRPILSGYVRERLVQVRQLAYLSELLTIVDLVD